MMRVPEASFPTNLVSLLLLTLLLTLTPSPMTMTIATATATATATAAFAFPIKQPVSTSTIAISAPTTAAFPTRTTAFTRLGMTTTSASKENSHSIGLLPLSNKVQQTLDPCVVLMKQIITEYSYLWQDDEYGILSLAQGVVYWDPPPTVQDALLTALTSTTTSTSTAALHTYGPDEGLPELREAIIQKLATENSLHHHIPLVTTGANQAYMNVVLTLLSSSSNNNNNNNNNNKHSKAIVFQPYYFNHVMAIQLVGGNDSLIVGPCNSEGVPSVEWLATQLSTDTESSIAMVTITNPGNPTGVALSREQLQKYVQITKQYNVWLVLDCTYEHFHHNADDATKKDNDNDNDSQNTRFDGCFDNEPHVIHIFSFSKGYALAGYRCGYVVLHEAHTHHVYQQMRKVQDTIPICTPRISQYAALGAMQVPRSWVLQQVQTLKGSRKAITDALSSTLSQTMGGSGAMYIMGKLPDGMNDQDVCRALVRDYGVAIIPGSFCGLPGWIRVCYSNLPPGARVEMAAARLKEGLRVLCALEQSL